MGRKGKEGDRKYITLIQTLKTSVSSAELGEVVKEALRSGWELKPLARAVGVSHVALLKWLQAAGMVNNDTKRGRNKLLDLLPSHAQILMQLASDPATSHLSAKSIWELYLHHFECSPNCQGVAIAPQWD